MTNHTFDILLRQGEVIDPSQSLHGTRDVGIRDGKIARIAEQLKDCTATHVVDARGLYVVPGLIDLHVHVYRDHCPLSLDPDELCPAGGVTTMLDAGSAGHSILVASDATSSTATKRRFWHWLICRVLASSPFNSGN